MSAAIAGIGAEPKERGRQRHTMGMLASEGAMNDIDAIWFSAETDRIVTRIAKEAFPVSISAIDELEEKARARLSNESFKAAQVSCADLRLDAAMCTHQSYDVCESLYFALLAHSVDACAQLTKATTLARSMRRDARASALVVLALERARRESAPASLVRAAEEVLAAG